MSFSILYQDEVLGNESEPHQEDKPLSLQTKPGCEHSHSVNKDANRAEEESRHKVAAYWEKNIAELQLQELDQPPF